MKLAIMSDSHDRWENLEKAINIANQQGCQVLLFAGDLISPPGIPTLEKFNGQIKLVLGNNEGAQVSLTRKMDASAKIKLCGLLYEETLDGVRIFMTHYPRIGILAAKSGEFDLVVYGDTHVYHEEKVGNCLLLNPGEIHGFKSKEPGFVIYDTATRSSTRHLLS